MRKLFVLLPLGLIGCASMWDRYPPSLYTVLREESPVSVVQHEKLLETVLHEAENSGKKPPAGIAAEYAYYCWKVGKQDKAREAIKLEEKHYPESRQFLSIMDCFLPNVSLVELPKGK